MSDEEMRDTILKACGWKHIRHVGIGALGTAISRMVWISPDGHTLEDDEDPPDVLNDLNAMHEVEKGLTTNDQVNSYEEYLKQECGSYRCALHSTARQRAHAFIKTISS